MWLAELSIMGVSGWAALGRLGWLVWGQAQAQQHRMAQWHMASMCVRVTAVVEDMELVEHDRPRAVHEVRASSRRLGSSRTCSSFWRGGRGGRRIRRMETLRRWAPAAWPAYGGLLLDARRLVRELATSRDDAVLPTDGGPFPHPAAES